MARLQHIAKPYPHRRWGMLKELDRRIRPGSPGFFGMPLRLRHLLTWRAMHAVVGGEQPHLSVRGYGTAHRIRPSSDLPLHGHKAYPIVTHPSKMAFYFSRIGKMQ